MAPAIDTLSSPMPRRRGRVPSRSRRELADAAVGLADRDGLGAVTMRSVAQALGTSAASLYRYVSNREDLVALMSDEASGELDLHGPDERPWMDQMLDLANDMRSLYRRHPWMLVVSGTSPEPGPNAVAYLEHALAVLAPAQADGGAKLEALLALTVTPDQG